MIQIFFSVFVLISAIARAEPILNQPVAFSTPILLTVFKDSKDPNQFYYQPDIYSYCGWELGLPEFSFEKSQDQFLQFAIIKFNLCLKSSKTQTDSLNDALLDLKIRNNNAVLNILPAIHTQADKLPKTVLFADVSFTCTPSNHGDTDKILCVIFAPGERGVRALDSVANGFNGLFSAGYIDRIISGVTLNEETGEYISENRLMAIPFLAFGMAPKINKN